MKLGLYGGSFDPVHLGHLLVAHAAREELGLDRIIFIPAAQSPFKPAQVPAPGHLRLRLLRLALAGFPAAAVDDQELRRGGPSFTVDTLRDHAARHPGAELFWLIGADHVPTLPKWREPDALAALATFVVIPRPGAAEAALPAPWRLAALRGFPFAVSSSQVRERVRAGLPVAHLLPPGVAEVISAEGLYRVAEAGRH
ncbi:MAG TPA: nicotinate (nicotinamide) nucleotide adenylyltransferase [Verrucomicrobiota bacterium]|nr:nicotinate (nicotinamide) nucleotide adenylyltransferase [Verrucomicrobiota bacterium]